MQQMYVTICAAILAAFGIAGNIIVLLSVFHWKKLHVPSNVLVCFLGVVDIVQILSSMAWHVTDEYVPELGYTGCVIVYFMLCLSSMMAITYMEAMIFERALAIYKPLLFNRYVSTRRTFNAGLIVGAVCLVPLAGDVVMVVNKKDILDRRCKIELALNRLHVYLITAATVGILLEVAILYAAIYRTLSRRNANKRQSVHVFTTTPEEMRMNCARKDHFTTLKISILFHLMFVIFWAPVLVYMCIVVAQSDDVIARYNLFGDIAVFLTMTKSILDPFLHIFITKDIKEGIIRLLRK